MALQLNPTVADPFETFPLYQLRRQIFDSLGFIYSTVAPGSTFEVPLFADSSSFAQMGPLPATDGGAGVNSPNSLVYEIKQRLGLPNPIGIKTDNLGTLVTQLCNFIGLGAMMKALPGNVIPLLTNFLNQAEQDLWRDIELDSGSAGTGATLISPPQRMGMAAVTATSLTFLVAAVGATQAVSVTSANGIVSNVTNTGITITDGVNTITGKVTNVVGSVVTVQTVSIDSGSSGATVALNAVVAFGSVCTLDSTAIMQRGIALAKDHYGQDDGQLYLEQSKKYVADYARRSPPNITSIIQLALIDAQRKILRRPELGIVNITSAGTKYVDTGKAASSFNNQGNIYPNASGTGYTLTLSQFLEPTDATSIDKEPILLLALATVKDMLKQADGKQAMDEFETYMDGIEKRLPRDAVTFVSNALRKAQDTLYRMYKVFRMERWFTWTEVANQNFYSMYGDDAAVFSPPTGLTVTLGTFGNFGQLNVGRTNAMVVTLADGRVLAAGGFSTGTIPTLTCEIYDPATGLCTLVAPLNLARTSGLAVLLANGKVLVTGGSSALSGVTLSSAEVYDPVGNTWTVVGSMSTPRVSFTLTALHNGKAVAIAGSNPGVNTALQSIEIFDPTTSAWTLSSQQLATGVANHAAILLSNETILIGGGLDVTQTQKNLTYLYIQSSDTLSAGNPMINARASYRYCTLPDGTIFVAGGSAAAGTAAEIYSPVAGTWAATTGNTTTNLGSTVPFVMPDGSVYVYGGVAVNTYDPVGKTFTAATNPTNGSRTQTVQLNDGSLLQMGSFSLLTIVQGYTVASGWVVNTSKTTGTLTYRVAAVNSSGSTLASPEVSLSSVTVGFAINLACNAVTGATQYRWYGRVAGAEQLIGTSTTPSFVDFNTNIPNGNLPTASTAAPVYTLDAREVTQVYASCNGTNWRPLIEGIPPFNYNATTTGPPQRYMIRQGLEVWPPPADNTWQIQARGFFKPLPMQADTDINSIDPHAIYLKCKFDAEIHYKRNDPRATNEELENYVLQLIAGTHNTHRYIPGTDGFVMNAVRPVLLP